jgi:hypothetical protein
MIDAALAVLVLGALALALGVDLTALVGWLRAPPATTPRRSIDRNSADGRRR